jgi:hypothetical protein
MRLLVVTAVLGPGPFASGQKTEVIQLQVRNAKNGKPVVHQKVSVAIKGVRDASEYVTNAEGNIDLTLNTASEIIPSTEWWVTCRAINPTAPHWFSVTVIANEGISDENNCGRARSEPQKGKLILFARKASLAELFAK